MIMGLGVAAGPIVFALAAYPDSFSLSWNQGRGGFLFALAFMAAELVGLRLAPSARKVWMSVPLAAAAMAYLAVAEAGLHDALAAAAEDFGVQLVYSWMWLWDYVVMASFLAVVFAIYFGKRWVRIAPAAPIFLGGSAVILSLDAFFRMTRWARSSTWCRTWCRPTCGWWGCSIWGRPPAGTTSCF